MTTECPFKSCLAAKRLVAPALALTAGLSIPSEARPPLKSPWSTANDFTLAPALPPLVVENPLKSFERLKSTPPLEEDAVADWIPAFWEARAPLALPISWAPFLRVSLGAVL